MRFFLTKRAYERSVNAELQKVLGDEIYRTIWLFSENPTLQRKALAAYYNISEHHDCIQRATVLGCISRAICAYGAGLRDMREGVA